MLKRYDVTLPFSGMLVVTVEAEDEKGAIDAALDVDSMRIDGKNGAEILEVEVTRALTRGNVFRGVLNEASAVLSLGEDE